MKLAGAGWVSATGYGAVRKPIHNEYENDLHRILKTEGFLSERVKNIGKFDPSTRRLFCAAALALHDANFSNDWKNIVLIGTGTEECTQANQTYFEDYAGHGRKLARANLFIYTLPTSPLAEIAIHFKLDGPLLYTAPLANIGRYIFSTANGLLADGESSHVLALWAEKDVTVALLLNGEAGELSETFRAAENPSELINYLKENR